MSRPKYVHCVAAFSGEPWCGVDHGVVEPFFHSVDHATEHGLSKSRLMVCPECRDAITKALNNGYGEQE